MHGNNFYIPINLEGNWSDKHLYIIDKLYTSKFIDKRFSADSTDTFHAHSFSYTKLNKFQKKALKISYVPLSSVFLRKLLGRNSKTIITELIHSYVVQSDNQYIVGEKSKGYRLAPEYSSSSFKTVPIQDMKFKKLIESLRAKEYDSLSPLHKGMFTVMQNDFSFNSEGARKYYATHFSENTSISYQLNVLNEKEYYFSTDTKTGRVFTNYTNLKREFRSFIQSANGEPLVELDIRNSQPLLLASLFNEFSHTSSSEYSCLCEQGIIYDYLSEKTGATRDKVKKDFLTVLFAPSHWDTKVKRIFQSDFPEVFEYVSSIKRDGNNLLALALQKCEADLVINTIGAQLLFEGIPFLSVHDSLIVTESQSSYVKDLMTQRFSEQYNINPIINIK
ncbi:Uncharacterised protein [uncultured archaeon]|nr:Uncharacterised protein [uncultured archaeon]